MHLKHICGNHGCPNGYGLGQHATVIFFWSFNECDIKADQWDAQRDSRLADFKKFLRLAETTDAVFIVAAGSGKIWRRDDFDERWKPFQDAILESSVPYYD